jgi:hypothetical protein
MNGPPYPKYILSKIKFLSHPEDRADYYIFRRKEGSEYFKNYRYNKTKKRFISFKPLLFNDITKYNFASITYSTPIKTIFKYNCMEEIIEQHFDLFL